MKRVWLHPLPLRVWHWVNTAVVLLLIVTGIQLRAPDLQLFPGYRIATLVHKAAGSVMILSFLFWLVYTLASRNSRRQYAIKKGDLSGMVRQARYYAFGLFKGQQNPCPASPQAKFNPLQKASYMIIQFLFTPIIAFTGILFGNILAFGTLIDVIGGVRVLDAIHVTAAYVFVLYLFAHIYMVTLGDSPFKHVKAMFTGYEDEDERTNP